MFGGGRASHDALEWTEVVGVSEWFLVDVSYQGHSSITKSEALEFLEWLRAGNEGGYLDFWDWKRSGGADDELA